MAKIFYVAQGAAAGFFFGTASIFVRFLHGLDAFTIVVFRVLVAAVFLWLVGFVFFRRELSAVLRRFSRELPLLGFLLGLHLIFFVLGVQNTSVVNATTLVNTTPAMALAIGWGLGWIKPSNINIIGLLLAVAGSASMTFGQFSLQSPNLVGDLYAVLGALFWALYLVFGKKVREAANIFAVLGPLYTFTALPALSAAYVLGPGLSTPRTEQLFALFGLAFFPTVLGHGLQFSSLRGLHPYQASSLALLEPIVATALAAVLLYEIADPITYVSAAAVITGIYLVIR
ncbi:MAG: DMT family transporter [Candidatus Caldarchaeum sp.]|nr:DMT family transporter [Candidatus Caldarchaeum sp.]